MALVQACRYPLAFYRIAQQNSISLPKKMALWFRPRIRNVKVTTMIGPAGHRTGPA
jgi:hypothetical protein